MAASCVAGVVGGASPGSQLGSLPETTPRSSLGSTPISSPQRKLGSPAWQATGVTWGYPSFRWGDGLGVRCDSLLSVLAVSRQVSTVRRPPSRVRCPPSRVRCPALHVVHSAYGTLRTAFGLSHSARSAVRDTSAHRYRPNPWISPATPRRLPGSSPICTEIPPEATRETRRNSVQSPKIPLRPRTSMVDGG